MEVGVTVLLCRWCNAHWAGVQYKKEHPMSDRDSFDYTIRPVYIPHEKDTFYDALTNPYTDMSRLTPYIDINA